MGIKECDDEQKNDCKKIKKLCKKSDGRNNRSEKYKLTQECKLTNS